jgi:hypothetical protein
MQGYTFGLNGQLTNSLERDTRKKTVLRSTFFWISNRKGNELERQ